MGEQRKDRAVLFDLDGTLLNTLDDIGNAMNYALGQFGLPAWERDAFRFLVGNGARILAERAVREHEELTEQVLSVYQHRYETHLLVETRPYPGMTDTLSRLRDAGIPLFVLSNKPDADTRRIISESFPEIPFSHVQGQRPGVPRKPDPSAALMIAKQYGIAPERFYYVGDTSVDMECARRAGMHPVGALWGFRTRTELQGSGAEFLIRHPDEIVEIAAK